jgi:hypothetical protein
VKQQRWTFQDVTNNRELCAASWACWGSAGGQTSNSTDAVMRGRA